MIQTIETAAVVWVERYETLRRYVLSERVLQAQPLSFVLWLAHGMAGWMSQWKIENVCAAESSAVAAPRCPATIPWQEQLTHLLAQMTTRHLQNSL